ERAIIIFRVVFVAMVMVGATRELSFVWNFSDLMNGLMAIPNLIGILLLSKVVKEESQRYFSSASTIKESALK
uniref:alanine:cation symporter family protein n=1 Tax=Methylophaga sp. TaxID=2024840 RepID=UPI003F69E6DA